MNMENHKSLKRIYHDIVEYGHPMSAVRIHELDTTLSNALPLVGIAWDGWTQNDMNMLLGDSLYRNFLKCLVSIAVRGYVNHEDRVQLFEISPDASAILGKCPMVECGGEKYPEAASAIRLFAKAAEDARDDAARKLWGAN